MIVSSLFNNALNLGVALITTFSSIMLYSPNIIEQSPSTIIFAFGCITHPKPKLTFPFFSTNISAF